ncbi:aminoacyl-tRNA hydrolase [Patescibacteria group bacterium]|nr:aminoacyl-tRNA hydrolase [Patescibacteria group bacterium]
MSDSKKVVVGLGNPDDKHAGTRHNIGWTVADAVAHRLNGTWQSKSKLHADVADANGALITKPTTYMNKSGQSVRAIADFYKVSSTDICVISDDINLSFGEIRFRGNGGAGGQNGLKDIISALGTEDFPRLRIGVGEPPTPNATPHVLGQFSAEEKKDLPDIINHAAERIEQWLEASDTEQADG